MAEDTEPESAQEKVTLEITRAEKVGLVAVLTNLSLTLLKFFLAFFTGSLALLAEAFHSFADIGSSVAVFIAVRAETKRKSEPRSRFWGLLARHPQRSVAVLIGLFLMGVAVGIIFKIFRADILEVTYPVPAGLAMLLLALGSFLLSRLELSVGEKENATALVADGHHARVDMAGSLLVAAALFGEGFSLRLDRYAAALIAVFILVEAFNVFVAVFRDLARKQEGPVLLYPLWMVSFYRKTLPRLRDRLYVGAARILRIDPSAPNRDERVSRAIYIVTILLALIGYLPSGFFTVSVHQQAIVEHFGRPYRDGSEIRVYPPGLHWAKPWPIDRICRVDSLRSRRMVIGSEIAPESKTLLWTNLHYLREHNILSGENIWVDIGLTLQYRISDPVAFLYSSDRPEALLEQIGYAAILELFAQREFFPSITVDRDSIENELVGYIGDAVDRYGLGIELQSVNLRDIHPPTNVAPEFEEVVSATVEYETYINEAVGYRNDVLPRERGKAQSTRKSAVAEKSRKILASEGETIRFLKTLEVYKAYPRVTRDRLFLEAVEQMLPGREKYIVPPEAAEGALDLYVITAGQRLGSRAEAPPLRRERRFGEVSQ